MTSWHFVLGNRLIEEQNSVYPPPRHTHLSPPHTHTQCSCLNMDISVCQWIAGGWHINVRPWPTAFPSMRSGCGIWGMDYRKHCCLAYAAAVWTAGGLIVTRVSHIDKGKQRLGREALGTGDCLVRHPTRSWGTGRKPRVSLTPNFAASFYLVQTSVPLWRRWGKKGLFPISLTALCLFIEGRTCPSALLLLSPLSLPTASALLLVLLLLLYYYYYYAFIRFTFFFVSFCFVFFFFWLFFLLFLFRVCTWRFHLYSQPVRLQYNIMYAYSLKGNLMWPFPFGTKAACSRKRPSATFARTESRVDTLLHVQYSGNFLVVCLLISLAPWCCFEVVPTCQSMVICLLTGLLSRFSSVSSRLSSA